MLITPYFAGGLTHNAVGLEVEFISVGFLECKDGGSNRTNCVEGFVKAGAITIKDTIQILAVDA